MQRLVLAAWITATLLADPLHADPPNAAAPEYELDACHLLGGRADRSFIGRPGNLYGVVGNKPRLIYMAGDLTLKSSLLHGQVVEWRPDFVQLQASALGSADGQPLDGVAAEKFCGIGPSDSVWVEYVFTNAAASERRARLSFDWQGVEIVQPSDSGWTFQVTGGYPASIIPRLYGALAASHPLAITDKSLQVDVPVPAGTSARCIICLAVGVDLNQVKRAATPSPAPRDESSHYWNRMLTAEIPSFRCSDPYLEKLYYFRWWSLLTKMNIGGHGRWSQPLAREGTVGFNALITYSGGPSTIDLRWMRTPAWAYGNIRSFYENLHDGKLANHIYPDSLDGDVANRASGLDGALIDFPYHNFQVKALADIHAVHPDQEMLRRLWPALQQATGLYDRELDADRDGLYETYPWSNITGQEWCARFLYFHPFDQLLSYERTWRPKDDTEAAKVAEMIESSVVRPRGVTIPRTVAEMLRWVDLDRHYRQETVDENCYAYADMTAMATIADILGEKEARHRWQAAAERTRDRVLQRLWDPATAFFYDRDGATHAWSRVKSPTGFYPFWAGFAGKREVALFKHLFNSEEFWTAFPVTTLSLDYEKRAELRRLGWVYWNGSNWPMTTSHVVDAAARAAKEVDASLAPGAAELLRRYTKVHFLNGDLQRPCVSEYFDPTTGQANVPNLDYAHSYYIDLILRHVVGIEAHPLSDTVRVAPLSMGLEQFEARNIWVKGHELAVSWRDSVLNVSVDGRPVARSNHGKPLKIHLPPTAKPAR